MYVYGACLFYVCCSDSVGVCWNVCCVAGIVTDSVFLPVCVRDMMDVVFCLYYDT